MELARKHGKPVLLLSRDGEQRSPKIEIRRFIEKHNVKVLSGGNKPPNDVA